MTDAIEDRGNSQSFGLNIIEEDTGGIFDGISVLTQKYPDTSLVDQSTCSELFEWLRRADGPPLQF